MNLNYCQPSYFLLFSLFFFYLQVNSSYLHGPYSIAPTSNGLETRELGLKFIAEQRHFEAGELVLKCTSSIEALYWNSAEAGGRALIDEENEVTRGRLGPRVEGKHQARLPRVMGMSYLFHLIF